MARLLATSVLPRQKVSGPMSVHQYFQLNYCLFLEDPNILNRHKERASLSLDDGFAAITQGWAPTSTLNPRGGPLTVGRGDFKKFSPIFWGIDMNTCVTITRTMVPFLCFVIGG